MQLTLTLNGTTAELLAALGAISSAAMGNHTATLEAPIVEAVTHSAPIEPEKATPPDLLPVAGFRPAPKAPAPKAPAPAEDTPVTLDMLRLASKERLSKSADVVKILGRYDAINLSTLNAEHYDAVYEQILAL